MNEHSTYQRMLEAEQRIAATPRHEKIAAIEAALAERTGSPHAPLPRLLRFIVPRSLVEAAMEARWDARERERAARAPDASR